ncbi:phage tail protein [Nostoc sp. NMS4]|uniref:phage tail protein n=1 Tax=Nostoc sp. NMS4 TaxID=2815390 RepID=UPI0025F0CDFC|nr:phage tail protein [Nostoc sp. NMS4]MBN3925129.1 phage tail protein [Nostoc sp. NMS4]
MAGEYLVASVFYFEADGITDKFVVSVAGLGAKNNATKGIRGSGKSGKVVHQNLPGQAEFNNVTITMNYNGDETLHNWYKACSLDGQPRQWDDNRKAVSVVGYTQDKSTEVIRYNLKNCFPESYTGPEFDVTKNDPSTEKVEVSIEGYEIIAQKNDVT